jgi:hypothetical protein
MNLKTTPRNGLLSLALICACLHSVPSYANSLNLIVNGSFEDPIVPESSTCGLSAHCLGFHNGVAGNDNIGGWQLIGKSGIDGDGHPLPGAWATILLLGYDYTELNGFTGNPLHFHPQHGRQSVDLTGEGNQGTTNGIKQAVSTDSGTHYVLTFWLGHQYSFAPGFVNGPGALALYVDGALIGSFENFGETLDDVHWTPFSHRFTASSSETVIAFLNDTPVGNNYSGLDNVGLHALPEPASLILLLGTGTLLALFRRNQRRSKSRRFIWKLK